MWQNEAHFYLLCKSMEGNEPVIQLYKSDDKGNSGNEMEVIASSKTGREDMEKRLFLKIEAKENVYSFSYAFYPDEWHLLKDSVDARFLSTRVAGGFAGCMYAIYATSLGKTSNTVAHCDWFEYRGDDEVYK